jgi:hypothetical protein
VFALRVRLGALPATTTDGARVALCWVRCGPRIVWLGLVDVSDDGDDR